MKQIIVLTGSGLVSKRLAERLAEKEYVIRFLSRRKQGDNYFLWNLKKDYIDRSVFDNVSHIVHLSGENIASKRWTAKRKDEIISSRVNSARLILRTLEKHNIKIKSFTSASAVGYYGAQTTSTIYCETDKKGGDFVSAVCDQWETAADGFTNTKIADRVVKIRIGVVLSNKGGAFPKMKAPVRYCFGPVLGSGNQYMPWIHIDDLCDAIEYSINNESMTGVFNAVSPAHITGKEFIKSTAKSMHKAVSMLKIPNFIIKFIFGEMSILLLEGSRVSSEKIRDHGFVFKYPSIAQALSNL